MMFTSCQPQPHQQVQRFFPALMTPDTGINCRNFHISRSRHIVHQMVALKNKSDMFPAQCGQFIRRHTGRIPAIKKVMAIIRGIKAAHDIHQCRLSGPVFAKDAMTETPASPPVAEQRDHTIAYHGITVADPYAWLRDPGYPEVGDKDVLAYLTAENAWFEARMAPQKDRIEALFKEMRARIKEADRSVPQKDCNFLYWI